MATESDTALTTDRGHGPRHAAVHVVWFKRDLRVRDHRPLLTASRRGPILPLFVFEPDVLGAEDSSERHLRFLLECLRDLDASLRQRGAALVTRVGRMPDVLDQLRSEGVAIAAVHAHEETTNDVAYQRDRRVRAWARRHGVALHEAPQSGVVRRLSSRDAWSAIWQERVEQPVLRAPSTLVLSDAVAATPLPDRALLVQQGIARRGDESLVDHVRGGETTGRRLLTEFLWERGRDYRAGMASPTMAPDVCSRISPHLAWGTLSVRQAWVGARHRAAELRALAPPDRQWVQSLTSFGARLQWRDHFIQKMEDEPALEFHNVCRAYDGLREESPDHDRLRAWMTGQTGFPLIDACMRALAVTGWLPFRMRAMVMSFAAYHLWLHWRAPALVLARAFLDYEPGIHYSQCQMQSGTTGINTFRIYNPYLQHARYDAQHRFVRRWVPELAALPDAYLIRPELAPPLEQQMAGCLIGRDYPLPIVVHESAYATARERMYRRRAEPQTRVAARAVYAKHGSRAQPLAERDL